MNDSLRLRLTSKQDVLPIDLPEWLTRKWTWKRTAAFVFLWFSMFWLTAIHLISQAFMGIVVGFGEGLVKGVEDTWKSFVKYWTMFEECE